MPWHARTRSGMLRPVNSAHDSAAPPSPLTSLQIKALIAAFLGWAFDGLDGYLYVMVANKFVGQLLGKAPNDPETIEKATIIQSVFLVGWAVGGAVFGRIGDRLGRAKTLTLTVLTYAIFTGMSYFATEWWHLMIFRFVAALGIGGEWAAGSALVSETLPKRHRVWGSAVLQSGYMTGCILAVLTTGAMSHLEPKWVFVVGVLPAFLTVFIRAAVPEPEGWAQAAKHEKPPPVSALFSRQLAKTTILVSLFASIAMVIAWALLFFVPQAITSLPEVKGWTAAEKEALKTKVAVVFFLFNIAGNFFATYTAQKWGYRRSFFIMLLIACGWTLFAFSRPLSTTSIYWATSIMFFFGLGFYGNFPCYIPPLFPTLVRTLGAGFTYNVGRLISAVGVFYAGEVTKIKGPAHAVWLVGFLFIPAMALALILPEPKREAAPVE